MPTSKTAKAVFVGFCSIPRSQPYGLVCSEATNNVSRRLSEHQEDRPGTFTAKDLLPKLLYVEGFASIMNAIDVKNSEMAGQGKIRTAHPDFND